MMSISYNFISINCDIFCVAIRRSKSSCIAESKYFIIKTLEKTVPTEEEVKEKAETGYKDKIQTEYAEARIDEMVKAQKVEKVKSVWDTLEKFH